MATKRVWTDKEIWWLGLMPDRLLAIGMGIHESTVGAKRRELGIARYRVQPVKKSRPYRKRKKKARPQLTNMRKLQLGLAVNIGGVLCKRCPRCWVTWPLRAYTSTNRSTSGVRGPCHKCRPNGKMRD